MDVSITPDGQGLIISAAQPEARAIVEALAYMANGAALRDHQRQRVRRLRAPLTRELERLDRLRAWEEELAAS